jgi:hypothetical protein
MRIEIELNKLIKEKYSIEKKKNINGTISILLTPKKRSCYICKKKFEVRGREFLYWKAKDNFELCGWFCRRHYIQAKELIKLMK